MKHTMPRPKDEEIASTWFLHWAVRYRWVGAAPVQLREMHEDCMAALAANPTAEGKALAEILDKIGEANYPKTYANEWLEDHPLEHISDDVARGT